MEDLSINTKPKSEKRAKNDAIVAAICEKHGGLERMRARLGFSQKQMSELLLVDPSAWTRWVRDGESAPAHIYQALAWYFESRGIEFRNIESPAPSQIKWKANDATFVEAEAETVTVETWEREKKALVEQWHESQKKAVGISDGWKLFLLMNSMALLYLIAARFL